MSAALITLREGLEAALIVAIVAMYLVKLGRRSQLRQVWAGVGGAALLSALLGAGVSFGVASLGFRTQEIVEGAAGLLAAGVLTWMIFWMRRQARALRGQLEGRVDAALAGGTLALPLLAFTAVGREGLETVLFLFAAFRNASSSTEPAVGAVAGLLAACAIGYAFYVGGRRVNLRFFFQLTGVLVIFLSAGLLASAVHELNEAGLLLFLDARAWDTSGILGSGGPLAALLRGLAGYEPRPTVLQVIVYWAYLLPTLWLFLVAPLLRSGPQPRSAAAQQVTAGV